MGLKSPRRLGDMPYEEMEKWTRWATHVAMLDRYDNMTQVRLLLACFLGRSATAAARAAAALFEILLARPWRSVAASLGRRATWVACGPAPCAHVLHPCGR